MARVARRSAQPEGRSASLDWDMDLDRWAPSAALDGLLGVPPDFVYSRATCLGLIRADFRQPLRCHLRMQAQLRQGVDQELPICRPLDGSQRWLRLRAQFEAAHDGQPRRLIGMLEDITEARAAEQARRLLEVQVERDRKMASLADLGRGVAHEMNNVLGAVLGVATAHQLSQPLEPASWQAMDKITQACMQGKSLLRGLLYFTRHELTQAQRVDLNRLIRLQLQQLPEKPGAPLRVQTDLQADLPAIRGDREALALALGKLLDNAVDAMPDGGTLTLRTRSLGQQIELQVSDSGPGMAPEVLGRALDPYFSTKDHRPGLGLSQAYATAKAHGGDIGIQSHPGCGTTVCIRLPALEGPPTSPSPPKRPAQTSAPQPHPARILVVDDDALIRQATRKLLEVQGHAVDEAASGEEALQMLAQGPTRDGVILDLNMPGMGGAATLPRLRQLHPQLPVLLATGMADQRALDLTRAFEHVDLLAKPFSLRELRQALARWA